MDEDESIYHCNKCEYRNKSCVDVKRHVLRKHNHKYLYHCNTCNEDLFDIYNVEKHCSNSHASNIESHIEDLLPEYNSCFRMMSKDGIIIVSFMIEGLLTESVGGVRSTIFTYMCLVCKKTFNRNQTCTRHILFLHCNKNLYECDMCGYAMQHRSVIEQHYNRTHPKKKKRIIENLITHCTYILNNRE